MKSLAVSVVTAAVLIGVFSVGSRGNLASQERSDVPWKVGQCYRVFTLETDTLYTFQVLEPPQGNWIRAKQVPEPGPFGILIRQPPVSFPHALCIR